MKLRWGTLARETPKPFVKVLLIKRKISKLDFPTVVRNSITWSQMANKVTLKRRKTHIQPYVSGIVIQKL